MAKIYVSSTYLDLQEHRALVEKVIRRMGHTDVAMEYYVAEDTRPVAKCLADVAACDVYVGIFAWRYGWQPKEKNPKEYSITEMEFRQAEKTGRHCLIFLLSDDAPWPRKHMDKDITKIEMLRNKASAKHTADYFSSPDELARKVAEAIYKQIPVAVPIPEHNLNAYYTAIRKRYGVLALEGLTPPQKEEYLQIQLRQVFVEQNVRESPPPVELPKEVWEKLSRDQDIHPEDLPSGITIEDVRKARETYYEKPMHPVLDVLTDSHYPHTIILGDPGSGKSTLARYVILSLIDPATDEKLQHTFDGYLPLLIELRSYAGLCADGKCTTFLEFLEYLGETEGWNLTKEALHNHLKNSGRALVIFDGLDEIFDPEQRETITNRIVGFTTDYPKARVIVTSRVIGYRRKILTDAGFNHFTLQDLDEKQVESFVARWYDLAMSDRPDEAKERCDRILKSFKDSASIRGLAGNPMLLTIMAIIGKHQELPRERWKLYDHAASVLIQHWDVNKHLKDESIEANFIGEDDKKELLQRMAYRMQRGDGGLAGNYIHRDGLQAEFECYLKERYSQSPERAKVIAEAMIQQFRERNFILSLYGANLYGFVHRAFMEYFCASAFVLKFEKTKELTIDQLETDVYGKHWEEQSWHEVLRLISGMVDEKWVVKIIEYLLKRSPKKMSDIIQFKFGSWRWGWPIPLNAKLAAECLVEVRNLGTLSGTILDMLKEEHPISTYTLSLLNERLRELPMSYELLFDLSFTNQEKYVRGSCLNYISEYYPNEPQILQLLRERAVGDDDSDVRRVALSALVQHYRDDAQTLLLLRQCAVKDKSDHVRMNALNFLAQDYHEDPQTFPFLCERAANDESPNLDDEMKPWKNFVRGTALDVIVEYWPMHTETIELLRDRAENDPISWMRDRAKKMIKELEGKKKDALDDLLATRIRLALGSEANMEETKMFGGIGFLINGNMTCGVVNNNLVVRVGAEKYHKALSSPHTRVFDMAGHPSKGWVMVEPEGCATDANLKAWVEQGLAFARSLPGK